MDLADFAFRQSYDRALYRKIVELLRVDAGKLSPEQLIGDVPHSRSSRRTRVTPSSKGKEKDRFL